jgi:hypothetical protein
VARGDLDGFLEAGAFEEVETADRLLRLSERPVGHQRVAVADADRAGPARRGQLVSREPDAPRLEVVHPGEALLVVRRRRARIGLGLTVHPLRVPAETISRYFIVAPLFESPA